jgi:hypothetical protein
MHSENALKNMHTFKHIFITHSDMHTDVNNFTTCKHAHFDVASLGL